MQRRLWVRLPIQSLLHGTGAPKVLPVVHKVLHRGWAGVQVVNGDAFTVYARGVGLTGEIGKSSGFVLKHPWEFKADTIG